MQQLLLLEIAAGPSALVMNLAATVLLEAPLKDCISYMLGRKTKPRAVASHTDKHT